MNSPDSDDRVSYRARLAREIEQRRKAAGLSQPQLANRIGYSRQYVSLAERNHNMPSRELISAIDKALQADGALFEVWRSAKGEQESHRAVATAVPATGSRRPEFDTTGLLVGSQRQCLRLPKGRVLAGIDIPVEVVPAIADRGRIVATPPGELSGNFLPPASGRSVVIAAVQTFDGAQLFAVDHRHARVRLGASNPGAPLLVPAAYSLDDFTVALCWAIISLDLALLDDDTDLEASRSRLSRWEQQSSSALGPDAVTGLSPISRMWVGSDFCARHILRNTHELTDVPQYWSREQRGEEAATWLLFAHKYRYLETTAGTTGQQVRSFCIPPDSVANCPVSERILLFLAIALHESVDITTTVCTEPEYTATPGFVSDGGRRAIVANWVNTDQIWQVGLTDHRPTLREFTDAAAWARHHTIVPGDTPERRLRALADYLYLDWGWVTTRASELADSGITGLACPRSRLLSVAGVERACSFLAAISRRGTS